MNKAMPAKVFFSWQSDRPTKQGRNLIENSLQTAVKNLLYGIEYQAAVRDGIELDSDTRNIPGSPRIFQTILNKIEAATIFVPDFTFVANRANGHPIPNPNVLIEYGYALRSIGEHRIVPVMNAAYGTPTRETMPFDLIEHRKPITYNVPEDADEAVRKAERDRLARIFESAFRTFFESEEYRKTLPKPTRVTYREPKDGRARFRAKGDPIGTRADVFAHLTGLPQDKLFLCEGPSMWLRVSPKFPSGQLRRIMTLEEALPKLAVLPFYDPPSSIGGVRGPDGCGFYYNRGSKEPAPSLVYVFTDDEIWTINTLRLGVRPDLLFLDEAQLVESLKQCVDFLKHLGTEGPYRCVIGAEDILDRQLYEDNFRRQRGLCSVPIVEVEVFFEAGEDPHDVLEPFLEEVFDKCGVRRPAKAAAI